ncbi:MAG: hypothetical protein KF729_10115 [Sandaracinaceae bacterium]|nr:hypothetical protein [Sandaracinaceae bacterium]
MRTVHTIGLLAATMALATGCLREQRYVTPEGGGPWVIAMQPDTPPFFESEDGNVYLVEQRVELDFRMPTDEELAGMGAVDGQNVPWGSLPFVRRDDVRLQLDWTLSNLADATVQVDVTVNGFNEFHEYDPGVQIVDDEVVADFSQWERSIRLGPGERRQGTVREEELDEVAVDLSTVVNGAPNPNQIVYFENQHTHDRRSMLYMPDVIAGLTGVRVGLRTQGTDADGNPHPVVLEFTVRATDHRRVLVQGEDEPWPLPAPALFGPADVAPPAP